MAVRLRRSCARTVLVVLFTWVIILTIHCSSGAWCRFASMSARKGSCIFPCRCTDGCNTTNGECINGGRCEADHPNDYRWHGTACQTGNVGYKKNASQSGENSNKWSKRYTASRAVDGNTDSNLYHNSCAHPAAQKGSSAWWMVDMGATNKIDRVLIYNRNSSQDTVVGRLDTFTLSVGNAPDSLTECAVHTGRVAASGFVETPCTAVGRYLQFRRNGGIEPQYTSLCEVVIIGHLVIDCQQEFCSSTCDAVIGCEACVPGRQQPECKQACDDGTFGVNCQEHCGHCKDNAPCHIENGHCYNGCIVWYTGDTCKTFIQIPHFGTLQMPEVYVINGSSVIVSWPTANNISSGFESYYYYEVWLHADGETERKLADVPQSTDVDQLESLITGLLPNTHYSVKVVPYRQHNAKHVAGTATIVTSFKTPCTDPDVSSGQQLGTSSVIIVAVSMFLLGLLVATVVTLAVVRMRTTMTRPEDADQQAQRPTSGSGADDVGAESNYVHPEVAPSQHDEANVYDVVHPTSPCKLE